MGRCSHLECCLPRRVGWWVFFSTAAVSHFPDLGTCLGTIVATLITPVRQILKTLNPTRLTTFSEICRSGATLSSPTRPLTLAPVTCLASAALHRFMVRSRVELRDCMHDQAPFYR